MSKITMPVLSCQVLSDELEAKQGYAVVRWCKTTAQYIVGYDLCGVERWFDKREVMVMHSRVVGDETILTLKAPLAALERRGFC